MEISVEDFNVLSAEQSRRDVLIAQQRMEFAQMMREHDNEVAALRRERDALWAEKCALEHRLEQLRTDFENVRYENHWIKTYILLSVERVKDFFKHIHDLRTLATLKSFILGVLPADASAEQVAFASEVMQLPMPDELPRVVNVSGNYNDVHDNGVVGRTDKEGGTHGR